MAPKLWSLWDMLEKDAGRLLEAVNFLAATSHLFSSIEQTRTIGSFDRGDLQSFVASLREVREVATDLDLPMSVQLSSRVIDILEGAMARLPGAPKIMLEVGEFVKANSAIQQLQAIKEEAAGKTFLGLDARGAALWRLDAPPFGGTVEQSFPSARADIEEASKCLAVDRATACVMHLMRATEVPLITLAAKLGIGKQNDWGSYIREIDKELDRRMKTAGKRSADEAHYAEAAEAFERVKRAWRNRTMHVDRTYTVERAREIFDATRDFMAYLAPTIHE